MPTYAQLKALVLHLLPSEPDLGARDGPCCYEFNEEHQRWWSVGCSCGNADDTQLAGGWAEEANRYMKVKTFAETIGVDLKEITENE